MDIDRENIDREDIHGLKVAMMIITIMRGREEGEGRGRKREHFEGIWEE